MGTRTDGISIFAHHMTRQHKELTALLRRRNLRYLLVATGMLAVVLPLFAVMDYLTLSAKWGPAVRNQFVLADISLFLLVAAAHSILRFAPQFSKKYVVPLFLVVGYALGCVQIYLLTLAPGSQLYILAIEVLATAILIHLRLPGALLYLGSWPLLCVPLVLVGGYSFLDVLPPIIAVACAGGVFAVFRTRSAEQTLVIRRKNGELARSQRRAEFALARSEELKQRQDGDYYLTSLLTGPLSANSVSRPDLNVRMLVQQKKEFAFRGRDARLGGDLCCAHEIVLAGRPYVAFANADAMGKSMQGAGGALVFGTVFTAIVERTQATARSRTVFPERWLKECYQELQSVFSTFEQRMLVTAVFGLVDPLVGLVYFLNADHPHPVHLHGNVGKYSGSTLVDKIGQTTEPGPLHVQTCLLEPGDTFVTASDGRDDVLDAGGTMLEMDELRFLELVTDGAGEPERILALLGAPQLTDDLSILAIGWSGVRTSASVVDDLLRDCGHVVPEVARDPLGATTRRGGPARMARHVLATLLRRREFERAADWARRLTEELPWESEFLFLAALAAKRTRGADGLESAADFGERKRLRDPRHLRNLVNLSDIQRLLGNSQRAHLLAREALLLDPACVDARRILDLISESPETAQGDAARMAAATGSNA